MTEIEHIDIKLWKADAIVLFDWLSWVALNTIPLRHPADKQALTDLLNRLEQSVPEPSTADIEEARADVAKDMDW